MFKYMKRFASTICFWWKEMKLRSAENAKLSVMQENEETEWRHPMASYGYYMTMNHNRKERLCRQRERLAAIS